MKARTAIYRISSPSGKVYIGSAVDYTKRWRDHKSDLRLGRHCNTKLQNAWNKYGDALLFEVQETVDDVNKLIEREQFWIDQFDTYRSGYNMSPKAGSPLGYRHTSDAIEKIRAATSTPERRALSSAVHKGKTVSAETRERQAAAKRGKPLSGETRQKMRDAHARRNASVDH